MPPLDKLLVYPNQLPFEKQPGCRASAFKELGAPAPRPFVGSSALCNQPQEERQGQDL